MTTLQNSAARWGKTKWEDKIIIMTRRKRGLLAEVHQIVASAQTLLQERFAVRASLHVSFKNLCHQSSSAFVLRKFTKNKRKNNFRKGLTDNRKDRQINHKSLGRRPLKHGVQ